MDSDEMVAAAEELARKTSAIEFEAPVAYVYRPLEYAWRTHAMYLKRYGGGEKRIVFVGMNPGPFGMAQTGVPFGEIAAVRDWMGISGPVDKPAREHPKRPVLGFECKRSEVSGKRLWGLFARRFGTAAKFFQEHFVLNYCPLLFLDEGGRNLTPDKLKDEGTQKMFAACDTHLRRAVAATGAEWVIGVGGFAEGRVRNALMGQGVAFGRIPHPSPANPAANKGWDAAATAAMVKMEAWE